MAPRWSNPSGSQGVHRFHVWPAGSDSYDHGDLTAAWDMIDDIIGIPNTGDWPPSKGVDGGIYKENRLLQLERLPIGTVVPFFKPTNSYPLPDGFAVCDGSVIASSDHDFTGIAGSVTLPDLRHAFVLGADPTKNIGTSAAAVGNAQIDTAAGAPGPQATGGSNQHQLTLTEIPSHNHGGGNHHHLLPRQIIQLPTPPSPQYLLNVRDQHTHDEQTADSGNIIASQGSDSPHENRPRYVGLVYLCKVKFIDTI